MNEIELKNELSKPAYDGLTTTEKRASLLLPKTVARKSISGSELFSYTVSAEYGSLTDVQKQQWLGLCAIDSIGKDAVPLIQLIFDNTTVTWASIVKTEDTTTADELGFPNISEQQINYIEARTY